MQIGFVPACGAVPSEKNLEASDTANWAPTLRRGGAAHGARPPKPTLESRRTRPSGKASADKIADMAARGLDPRMAMRARETKLFEDAIRLFGISPESASHYFPDAGRGDLDRLEVGSDLTACAILGLPMGSGASAFRLRHAELKECLQARSEQNSVSTTCAAKLLDSALAWVVERESGRSAATGA